MATKTKPTPTPPRNRSVKRNPPRWPLYVGGAMGLFIATFFFGMYVLPQFMPKQGSETVELLPDVEPIQKVDTQSRVKVTELSAERSRRSSPRGTPSPSPITAKTEETPAAASGKKENASIPSPPAVAASTQPKSSPPAASPQPTPQAEPEDEPVEDEPAPSSTYRVQAGAFEDEANARKMADRLASSGYTPSVTTSKDEVGTMYRVQVGPFNDKREAENAVRDLGQQGISARVAGD